MVPSKHQLLSPCQVVNLNRFTVVNLDRSKVISLNRTGVVNLTGFCTQMMNYNIFKTKLM